MEKGSLNNLEKVSGTMLPKHSINLSVGFLRRDL